MHSFAAHPYLYVAAAAIVIVAAIEGFFGWQGVVIAAAIYGSMWLTGLVAKRFEHLPVEGEPVIRREVRDVR